MPNAALLFEPDAYVLDGPKLMGRQAAGNAFFRAAVAGLKGQTLWAYTPYRRSFEVFAQLVAALDPAASSAWLRPDRLAQLAAIGTLYLPGPGLGDAARLRLRVGPRAYSLVGVTHTTASHLAMDAITGLLTAPVMPWDALICTSSAVQATVRVLLEAEADYLAWRLGASRFTLPRLPTIPLGVHCDDFAVTAAERAQARAAHGIAADEVVALFVGRLSFHAKAHPHAMYVALEAARRRTGGRVALLQCGWFANESIENAFKDGAATFCPGVRALWADGKDPAARRAAWAAADLFVSLSDNIQETFGLTPVEAMAAGLPAVVADWDGYKDTVRDGIDGFRIPTWMPAAPAGEPYALGFEAGTESYDHYCGLTCQTVSVDHALLADRLTALIGNAELRGRMRQAGQQRAREAFDWAIVFHRYQALWAELAEVRAHHPDLDPGRPQPPRCAPARLDPFLAFRHYPTHAVGTDTVARLTGATQGWAAILAHPLFAYAQRALPTPAEADALLQALTQADGLSAAALAERIGGDARRIVRALAALAKAGLVRFDAPPPARPD